MQYRGSALHSWQDGERRLSGAPAERRATLERVCGLIQSELRRRLGGSFTSAELVELYDRGTSWCLQLAAQAAPERPWAWDAWVADAAFNRYLRDASDYSGGRLDGRD
ncbi:MAG: hypothetical protein NVSMB51_16300 [Solirubrobacteraceae bacterium]